MWCHLIFNNFLHLIFNKHLIFNNVLERYVIWFTTNSAMCYIRHVIFNKHLDRCVLTSFDFWFHSKIRSQKQILSSDFHQTFDFRHQFWEEYVECLPACRVAKVHSYCRSLFAKEPLIIKFLFGKWPVKIWHPVGLRPPVCTAVSVVKKVAFMCVCLSVCLSCVYLLLCLS